MGGGPRFEIKLPKIEVPKQEPQPDPKQEIPDLPDAVIPDVPEVPEFGEEPVSMETMRRRAQIAAETAEARKKVLGTTAVVGTAGYLGYKAGLAKPTAWFLVKWFWPYAAWKSLPLIDWFARKLDKWSDGLIDKRVPFAKTIAAGMDWIGKKLSTEKTLFETIKKEKEEKKKKEEKALEDLRKAEKDLAKKQADAAKKKKAEEAKNKRKEKVAKRWGANTAESLFPSDDEDDGINEPEPAEPEPAPTETKAA